MVGEEAGDCLIVMQDPDPSYGPGENCKRLRDKKVGAAHQVRGGVLLWRGRTGVRHRNRRTRPGCLRQRQPGGRPRGTPPGDGPCRI